MIIKPPPCIDVSHHRPVADFAQVSPRPLLAITKATESLSFVDETFVKHFSDMKQDGIHRGCYHFHRKAADATKQAQHFCNTIRAHITDKDLLVLDVEEGGETAAQLKTWFDFVRSQFPRNRVMIYSRKNLLDPIPMTQTQKDYFRQIPTWVAGYPNNPDLFSSVPAVYIPDQTKWGVVWLWQYTDRGPVAGVGLGTCDCNWMAPVLIALLGESTPQPIDVITEPHPGMKRISGVRHTRKFELLINDPAQVRFESVCLSPLETVSSVVNRKGATAGFNGGEWDRLSRTKDYTVSNQMVCRPRVEAVPSLMILNGNIVKIDHVVTVVVKQALSGLRYLIRDGVVQAYLSGTEPQYTEGHARSIHGINAAGHHMCLTSEGVYANQGLTLKQAAELMKQYGAIIAFDSGGGGDAEVVLDGVLLTKTENINPTTGQHFERPLPNVFLVYAGANPMPEPEPFDYYLYTTTAERHAVRQMINGVVNVLSPYITDRDHQNWYAGKQARGKTTAADRYTLMANVVNSEGKVVGLPGDIWRHIYLNDGASVDGWVADIHMGLSTINKPLTLVPANPTEPGVSPVVSIVQETNFTAKTVTITKTRKDGTSQSETDPIE